MAILSLIPTSIQTPIVNGIDKYLNGLSVDQPGGNEVGIDPGVARDSTNTNDMSLPVRTILNFLVNGVNGLDTGSLVANKVYALFLIGDSTGYNPTATLASLSTNSPILPVGYDMFRRFGWQFTNSSAIITGMNNYGHDLTRTYYYGAPPVILTAGTATTFNAGFINLTTLQVAPPIESQYILQVVYTPAAANHTADFALANAATVPIVSFGTGVAAVQTGQVTIPGFLSSNPFASFRYRVAAGDSLNLNLIGFTDSLL